jgi:hypothetical protein
MLRHTPQSKRVFKLSVILHRVPLNNDPNTALVPFWWVKIDESYDRDATARDISIAPTAQAFDHRAS